jgi:glycosyltransferase involved in cell wall biosynthesis
MRILHLPTLVGGMPWGLAQGERKIGLDSEVLALYDSLLQYPANRVIFKNNQKSLARKILAIPNLIKEVYRIRKNYDVFHFNFGSSLIDLRGLGLHLIDLPFYEGKIVVTYNGCDARQKYPTINRVPFSACHQEDCYQGICNNNARDEMKRLRIAKFDQYAHAVFAVNPDLLNFLPKRAKFLPYAISNWDMIKTLPYSGVNKKLKIVHSPTNRAAKGSDSIIQCLKLVKDRYGDFVELLLVENLPNEKARQVYAQADLAIDQILIGWYGGFAVEVMKMGIPVVAFIRKEDLQFLPTPMALDCEKAIIQADPTSLFGKLQEIIENASILRSYREAGLEYVHQWHDPINVAQMTKSVYES